MPTLEGIEPSWIQDGWQIQGEQNETRFDDDIPWDITAWTRDQQTQDQQDFNCCQPTCIFNCPTDPFQATIDVTISGISPCPGYIDCGINGTFTIANIGASQWTGAGGFIVIDGTTCGGGTNCDCATDPIIIGVTCIDGNYDISYIDGGLGGLFVSNGGSGSCPVNFLDCDSAIASGGTITLV